MIRPQVGLDMLLQSFNERYKTKTSTHITRSTPCHIMCTSILARALEPRVLHTNYNTTLPLLAWHANLPCDVYLHEHEVVLFPPARPRITLVNCDITIYEVQNLRLRSANQSSVAICTVHAW